MRRVVAQPPRFGTQDYWETFYSGNTDDASQFEWFCGYDMLQPFIHEFVQPVVASAEQAGARPKILMAGCGNSLLGSELYDDFLDCAGEPQLELWGVDYAAAAIARAKAAAGSRRMRHVVADLCDLPRRDFPDASFDVVLDKGAIDALFCMGLDAVLAAVREFGRVLRPGGLAFIVSGVPSADEVVSAFKDWEVMLDGSPYITKDGDATINLDARLYVFRPRAA